MKEEFLRLLEINLDKKYLSSLENEFNFFKIKNAILNKNLQLRERLIRAELDNNVDKFNLKALANPYYIGFGNPNSDILVIGKEKAFNVENTQLLIKESINNYAQWKEIIKHGMMADNQITVCEKLGFNPLLPKSFHQGKTKSNHTWSKTSLIIKNVYKDLNLSVDENSNLENSIFFKCFMTELNYIPAKYHEGTGLQENRKWLLKNSFFTSFPVVIFSAKSYLRGKEYIIDELFSAKYQKKIELDVIGSKRKRSLNIEIYKSNRQTIMVCDQLSGASGWSNHALMGFSKTISNNL
jgi:hypothetical protein